MPQGGALRVHPTLQIVPRPHQVLPHITSVAVALPFPHLDFIAAGQLGNFHRRHLSFGIVEFPFPVLNTRLSLRPLHLPGKCATTRFLRVHGKHVVALDHRLGRVVHRGVRGAHAVDHRAQEINGRVAMGCKRYLVLARARVPAQRLRLYTRQLDHVEQRTGDGRRIEVIEEYRQVRLPVHGRQRARSKPRDDGPGAMDIERERAEFPKPELHQYAQPVDRRVQRFVLEEVDGSRQVDAAAVGGIFVAHIEMAVASSDPLGEQREGTFDIGEVDHGSVDWRSTAGSRRRYRRLPSAHWHRPRPSARSRFPKRASGQYRGG